MPTIDTEARLLRDCEAGAVAAFRSKSPAVNVSSVRNRSIGTQKPSFG